MVFIELNFISISSKRYFIIFLFLFFLISYLNPVFGKPINAENNSYRTFSTENYLITISNDHKSIYFKISNITIHETHDPKLFISNAKPYYNKTIKLISMDDKITYLTTDKYGQLIIGNLSSNTYESSITNNNGTIYLTTIYISPTKLIYFENPETDINNSKDFPNEYLYFIILIIIFIIILLYKIKKKK